MCTNPIIPTGCKQVPPELINGKILFAHPDGYFVNQHGQRLKHLLGPANRIPGKKSRNGITGSKYPQMRHFSAKACHSLMCATFHGPRPEGYQCDHLNGNKFDYSAANLEWVTPAENIRRAKILRALRAIGRDPKLIPYDELRAIMNHYEFVKPSKIKQL